MMMAKHESEKLVWLLKNVRGRLPNIYSVPDFKPNGCGPTNWKSRLVRKILNNPPGLPNVEVAGDYHDYLCWLGGGMKEFIHAAKELRRLMRALCPFSFRLGSFIKWWRMRRWSGAYYLCVRYYGARHFNWK